MAKSNKKSGIAPTGMDDPAVGVIAINYTTDQILPVDGRRLYITTAGNLSIVCPDGSSGNLPFAVGIYAIQVRRINAAGSTAAGWILM